VCQQTSTANQLASTWYARHCGTVAACIQSRYKQAPRITLSRPATGDGRANWHESKPTAKPGSCKTTHHRLINGCTEKPTRSHSTEQPDSSLLKAVLCVSAPPGANRSTAQFVPSGQWPEPSGRHKLSRPLLRAPLPHYTPAMAQAPWALAPVWADKVLGPVTPALGC
jgi:hypothetical protein